MVVVAIVIGAVTVAAAVVYFGNSNGEKSANDETGTGITCAPYICSGCRDSPKSPLIVSYGRT